MTLCLSGAQDPPQGGVGIARALPAGAMREGSELQQVPGDCAWLEQVGADCVFLSWQAPSDDLRDVPRS